MTFDSSIDVKKQPFRGIFRLVWILFSLYLLADAFSRWDGFSYYAPFSEFIPSFALALILWNIVAVITAVLLWLGFKLIAWSGKRVRLIIGIEHLLLNAGLFVISGAMFWKAKKILWPDIQTTFSVKLGVFLFVVLLSMYLTWLFRDKASKWVETVLERVYPLVLIFGALIVVSVPVVSYHTWFKGVNLIAEKAPAGMQDKRPNIIFITFDALAAREMSLYGYTENTTPFINGWADNATVFTMVEAGSNFTTPAAASFMTGKRVWTHQTYHIDGSKPVRSEVESLPAVLKENGYFNIALVVNPFASVKVLGMSKSFDIAPLASEFSVADSFFGWKFGIIDVMLYRTFGEKIRLHNWIIKNDFILSKVINLVSRNISETTVPPEKAFNKLLDIIDNNVPHPFFVWIHVFPPHDPYLPPEPFKEVDVSNSNLRKYKNQEKLIEESYKYLFQYKRFPEEMQPIVELMRSYYDEFIRYSDKQFQDFITSLSDREIDNTVIILSSDHGESFEHGYFTHGGPFLYEQVTHIPLIIKESGQSTGLVVDELAEQVDIPATVLDLVNINIPLWMEGRSLLPLMRGESLPPRPAFSMNFQENRSLGNRITKGSVTVWDGDYKLIHYLGIDKSLLFNLRDDPNELNNIIDRETEIGQRLLKIIKDDLNKANENNIQKAVEYQ